MLNSHRSSGKCSLDVQFQEIDQSGTTTELIICTYSRFNVVSCGLIQLTIEPRLSDVITTFVSFYAT